MRVALYEIYKKMCLYPRLIKNKKYIPTKKNEFNPPECKDERLLYVPIKCGQCIECKKQEYREWRIRLEQELNETKEKAYFVTLTFNQDKYKKYISEEKSENDGVTIAVRHFLERWRKETGKSPKHWLITEKGGDYSRIHLHGLIFTNRPKEYIEKTWQNGFVYIGEYVNVKTINYITKYILKIDEKHKDFTGKKFISPGIGKGWVTKASKHYYKESGTQDYTTLENGAKVQMPIYYRNKIYTEDEREKLWIEKTEKNKRYINGVEYDMKKPDERAKFFGAQKRAQARNQELGYGGLKKEWTQIAYSKELKKMNKDFEC